MCVCHQYNFDFKKPCWINRKSARTTDAAVQERALKKWNMSILEKQGLK